MVRNYKLFLFAQLIALSVVAPALAMEAKEDGAPARKPARKPARARISASAQARIKTAFAEAIAREESVPALADNAAEQVGCSGDLEDLSSYRAPQGSCGSCHACPSHQGDDQAASEISLTPQQIQAINEYRAAMELCEYLNALDMKRRNCCKKVGCVIS